MEDREIRAALDRHWAASDANDLEGEHQIYREDAVLEYPQSGERIRGRRKIQSSRAAQPNSETLHSAADNRRGRPLGH
ncbi:MAG: nuclear transport factor 2 family protein [Allosphingosinicella sp.]